MNITHLSTTASVTMRYTNILVVVIAFAVLHSCQSRNSSVHTHARRSANLNFSGFIQWNFGGAAGSNFVQKTVGYLVSQERFGQAAPCFTLGSSIYAQGKPVFIDGSTGFYDGTVCWVKGATNVAQTEVCYARGTVVRNLFRSNVPEYACVVEEFDGFVIGSGYVQGVSPYALTASGNGAGPVCSLPSTNYDYVLRNVLYGVGTSGYVYGTSCWIRGTRMDGSGSICDYPGTTGDLVGPAGYTVGRACYSQFSSVYIMGNGYQQLPGGWAQYAGFSQQKLELNYAGQVSTSWTLTGLNIQPAAPNYLVNAIGSMKTADGYMNTLCQLQASSLESGMPNFADGSTGWVDGGTCWIAGINDQGAVCSVKGEVRTFNRGYVSTNTCYLALSIAYDMENNYALGEVTVQQPPCTPPVASEHPGKTNVYRRGSRGFAQGYKCWIEGTQISGQQGACYIPGILWMDPASRLPYCFMTMDFAYTLGTGYIPTKQNQNQNQVSKTAQFNELVGYKYIGGQAIPTKCYTYATNFEEGDSLYYDGSFGYFDGTSCWVKGTTLRDNEGDLCYTKGTVKTVYRRSAPQVACTVTLVEGYDFENNYVPGSYSIRQQNCIPWARTRYLDGAMKYFRGSQGLVQGNECWIQGQNGCYSRGSTWIEGALKSHQACYLTVDFNFIMGNGYQRSNIFELVPAERQLGGFFYKTVGYLKTDSGAEKTTICFAQGGSLDVGEINFVDNSTGYYDRSNCWIKGTTAEERGESCDIKGNVEIKQRGSRQEHSCVVTTITRYSIGAGFTLGAPSRTDSGCQFALKSNEVRGTVVYEDGASGFVQGNDCWIQGIKNGEVCYGRGIKGFFPEATGSPNEACFAEFNLAFSMKNYVMMNIDVAANPSVIFGKTSRSIQQSVGFVKGEGDLLKICHTLGTEIERGFPHYVEGSTGFFDGDKCFVRGKTDFQHGTDCYVPGAVKTMYRNNSLVVVCSKLDVIGAVMEGKYTPGSPYRGNIGVMEPSCSLPSGRIDVNGKISYLRGTSGFFDGTNCWIVGVTTDGHESCHISGITNYGQDSSQWNEPACYVMTDIAYMMATGFENLAVDFGKKNKTTTLKDDMNLISVIKDRSNTSEVYTATNTFDREVKIISKPDSGRQSINNNLYITYIPEKQTTADGQQSGVQGSIFIESKGTDKKNNLGINISDLLEATRRSQSVQNKSKHEEHSKNTNLFTEINNSSTAGTDGSSRLNHIQINKTVIIEGSTVNEHESSSGSETTDQDRRTGSESKSDNKDRNLKRHKELKSKASDDDAEDHKRHIIYKKSQNRTESIEKRQSSSKNTRVITDGDYGKYDQDTVDDSQRNGGRRKRKRPRNQDIDEETETENRNDESQEKDDVEDTSDSRPRAGSPKKSKSSKDQDVDEETDIDAEIDDSQEERDDEDTLSLRKPKKPSRNKDVDEKTETENRTDESQEKDRKTDTSRSRPRGGGSRGPKQPRDQVTDDDEDDYGRGTVYRKSQNRTRSNKDHRSSSTNTRVIIDGVVHKKSQNGTKLNEEHHSSSSNTGVIGTVGRSSTRRVTNGQDYGTDRDYENYDGRDAADDFEDASASRSRFEGSKRPRSRDEDYDGEDYERRIVRKSNHTRRIKEESSSSRVEKVIRTSSHHSRIGKEKKLEERSNSDYGRSEDQLGKHKNDEPQEEEEAGDDNSRPFRRRSTSRFIKARDGTPILLVLDQEGEIEDRSEAYENGEKVYGNDGKLLYIIRKVKGTSQSSSTSAKVLKTQDGGSESLNADQESESHGRKKSDEADLDVNSKEDNQYSEGEDDPEENDAFTLHTVYRSSRRKTESHRSRVPAEVSKSPFR